MFRFVALNELRTNRKKASKNGVPIVREFQLHLLCMSVFCGCSVTARIKRAEHARVIVLSGFDIWYTSSSWVDLFYLKQSILVGIFR